MRKLRPAIALPILALSLLVNAQNAPSPGKVVVAGTGPEPHINTVVDGLLDQLKAAGVPAKPFVGDAKSRSAVMESLKSSPGDSLLYISVDSGTNMTSASAIAQCFDKDGNRLWEEKASGGISLTKESNVKGVAKNLGKKLEKHIGQPCLPKA